MKMATLSRVGWNLGGLAKAAGYALSGTLLLGGSAFGQIVLGLTIDAPAEVDPGTQATVTFTIDRIPPGDIPADSDVKALGAEITLPTGWKLVRDIDANCAIDIDDNQIAGTNSTIQVKGSNTGLIDPTHCAPIPATGDVLEVFWIPESGGSGDPLPVNFPVVVTANFDVPANCAGTANFNGVVKYRVLAGLEQTANGTDSTNCTDPGCALPGDVDDDGAVTPGDAQMAFDFFLGAGQLTNPDCGDLCADGSVNPGDAQGMFNTFLVVSPICE